MPGHEKNLALALKIAGRELRGGLRGFYTFLSCLALGVAAVAAVGLVSLSVQNGVRSEAKTILGGDLEIRQTHRPLPAPLLDLAGSKGRLSHNIRMRTMARRIKADQDPLERKNSLLVELKGVDKAYPLYGELRLESGRALAEALAQVDGVPGAVADQVLLARLGVAVGDRILLGHGEFRLNDVILKEPDRATALLGLGPRLMVGLESMEATGLLRPESMIRYHCLLRLDDKFSNERALAGVKRQLETSIENPSWRVRDYSSAGRGLKRFFNDLGVYLNLVGLTSLLLGGIGAANAVRGYLESRMESIAAMKCLGCSRRLITQIYLAQTSVLSLAGGLLGVVLGLGAAWGGSLLLSSSLGLPMLFKPYPGPMLIALAYGLLTSLLFSLRPLSAAASVSPARLFRGYADSSPLAPSRTANLLCLAPAAGLLILTLAYARDLKSTLGFAGAVILCVAGYRLIARLVVRLARTLPRPADPRLRLALSNIHRPGSATRGVMFSLGLGLTVLCTVVLVDSNQRRLIDSRIPEVAPSYFFLDLPSARIEEFRGAALAVPGVERIESQPSIRGRITKINSVPADKVEIDPSVSWAIRGDRAFTYAGPMPDKVKLAAGKWWPANYSGKPLICLDSKIANGFGVGIGDSLSMNILGREITAEIACTREIDWTTLALNHAVIFSPGVLEKAPHSFLATAYASSQEAEDELFSVVSALFPDTAILYIKDVLKDVTSLMDKIGTAILAASSVTLLTGLLVLAETLRSNLRSRYYDSVLFKVLGAAPRDIMLSLWAEFAMLGLAAVVPAALLGAVLAWLFVTQILHGTGFSLYLLPLTLICLGGLGAALVLGLSGVGRILSHKAWPILRNE